MDKKQAIRFTGELEIQGRPGLLHWIVLGAVLILCQWLASKFHFHLPAMFAAVFVLIYLPALLGSLMGWFFGGVRSEIKDAKHALKLRCR